MISKETYAIVRARSGGVCENPDCDSAENLEQHHCYWRSQYRGTDRDDPWNVADACLCCHRGTRGVHNGNKELDKFFKSLADQRKAPELRAGGTHRDLTHAALGRKREYRRRVAQFKEKNDGLSPSQVARRRQKAWLAKMSGK